MVRKEGRAKKEEQLKRKRRGRNRRKKQELGLRRTSLKIIGKKKDGGYEGLKTKGIEGRASGPEPLTGLKHHHQSEKADVK